MKKLIAILSLLVIISVVGCNSDSTTSSGGGGTLVTGTYSPLTSGSWWKYQTDTNTYTLVVGPSATINGKTYTSLYDQADTTSGNLLRNEGTTTYTVTVDSSLTVVEVVFYKQSVSATWSYDGPSFFGVTTKFNGKTVEGGISRTVLSKPYHKVNHTPLNDTVESSEV